MRAIKTAFLGFVLIGSTVSVACVAEHVDQIKEKQIKVKQVKPVEKLKNKNNPKDKNKPEDKNNLKNTKKVVVRGLSNNNQQILDPIQMIMSDGPINTPGRLLGAINILLEYEILTTQEIIRILGDAGAEINAVDRYGCTALHWAAKYGHLQCVEILLRAGVNVNAVGITHHRTALHRAARYAQKECVEMLLGAGAEIDSRDSGNQTALHRALKGKNKLNVLVMSGAERADLVNKYNLVIQVLVKHYLADRKAIPADLRSTLQQMRIKI